jgi:hypothetical protein
VTAELRDEDRKYDGLDPLTGVDPLADAGDPPAVSPVASRVAPPVAC